DVIGLAFSPDSRTLASVTSARDDCQVRLWDVATAKPAGTPTLGGANSGNFAVTYLPDGRGLVCGGWGLTVYLFGLATGKQRFAISNVNDRFVRAISITPDGRVMVTGGGGATRLWDLVKRREIPSQLPEGLCPTFLPGGKELACSTCEAGRITL